MISVQGFRETPFFCGRDFSDQSGKFILREGSVYIRDQAAKTVVVAGPEHWEALHRTAVSRRQEQILGQFQSLLGQLGLKLPAGMLGAPKIEETEQWLQREREAARQRLDKHGLLGWGFLDVAHYPLELRSEWNQSDLLLAAQRAVCRNTGWPMGVVLTRPESAPQPTPDGIRASIFSTVLGTSLDYWSFSRRGVFYLLRTLSEDANTEKPGALLWFDTRIWRVAEALLHCFNLYSALGLEPTEEVVIEISHRGLRGRFLGSRNPLRHVWARKCEAEEVVWQKNVPLGAIESNLASYVEEIVCELFVLFEFWRPGQDIVRGVVNEFLNSRV